ncbi:hypothetical protein BH09ACT8_BH09ACT8_31270 [soil metagenome]
MSVGATRLTAVTADDTVSWPPVVTLDRGLVIGDFVDRVGDPIAILAADGSSHRSEVLLAEALRALAYSATGGRPLPDVTAISYPSHWRPAAVEALRRALRQVPEWSRVPVMLLPDVAAVTTALAHDPGLPARGVIAVCDVGGSGTTLSLVDAAGGYRPIGPVVRHVDFSGDLVDQAVLTQVIGDLAGAGSVDLASTSAIGSLSRLRVQCRGAKERLAAGAVTALPVELPGYRGDVRLTRDELDDAVRAPLRDVVELIHDTMRRNGIRPGDLAAVATVGGGASMAAVTTALSEHLRVPVITTARPAQSAAIGAALRALRGPDDDSATAMAPAAPATMAAGSVAADLAPAPAAALAWSQADDLPELELPGLELADYNGDGHGIPGPLTSARPQMAFEEDPVIEPAAERTIAWYRSSLAVMAAAVVVIAGAVSAVGVVLASDSMTTPASTPTPSITETPAAPAPALAADQPPAAAPQPAPQQQASGAAPAQVVRTLTAVPAPVTQTQVIQQAAPAPPPPAPEAPPPVTVTETAPPQTETVTPSPEAPPPSTQAPPPTTEAPPPSTQPPVAQPAPTSAPPQWVPPIPTIPAIPTIPGLPQMFQPATP